MYVLKIIGFIAIVTAIAPIGFIVSLIWLVKHA